MKQTKPTATPPINGSTNVTNKFVAALKTHYSAPLVKTFKQFRDGAIYFAVGLIIIYLANTAMDPSVWQELIVLFGLCLGAVGFVMAMLAQVRMVVSRIYHFFLK